MSRPASAARGPEGEPAKAPALASKLYFRIGEASRILGLPPHVLRYWETEFPSIAPKKSPGGQRMYRRKDLELLLLIKHLLYERKFTIAGARQWLAEHSRKRKPSPAGEQGRLFADPMATLEQVRRELAELIELLK